MIREQTFVILCQKKLVILRKLVTTYSLSLKRSIQLKLNKHGFIISITGILFAVKHKKYIFMQNNMLKTQR